jgi:capsule biosynthesis phosphatase
MKTYNGDLAKINFYTLPILTKWLKKHNVPYDGIIMGKPWCGEDGFYVDDKAIRPKEFLELNEEEIKKLIN